MLKQRYRDLAIAFVSDHAVYWNNLSRLNNLLIIMNISMFFLTGLISQGYYYTFYSLFFFSSRAASRLIRAFTKPGAISSAF